MKEKLRRQLTVATTMDLSSEKMHKLVPIVIDSSIKIPQDVPGKLK